MNTSKDLLEAYLEAKDLNRPHLILECLYAKRDSDLLNRDRYDLVPQQSTGSGRDCANPGAGLSAKFRPLQDLLCMRFDRRSCAADRLRALAGDHEGDVEFSSSGREGLLQVAVRIRRNEDAGVRDAHTHRKNGHSGRSRWRNAACPAIGVGLPVAAAGDAARDIRAPDEAAHRVCISGSFQSSSRKTRQDGATGVTIRHGGSARHLSFAPWLSSGLWTPTGKAFKFKRKSRSLFWHGLCRNLGRADTVGCRLSF